MSAYKSNSYSENAFILKATILRFFRFEKFLILFSLHKSLIHVPANFFFYKNFASNINFLYQLGALIMQLLFINLTKTFYRPLVENS